MDKNDVRYSAYVQILKEELIPAMGCTEPIALAYAAARVRDVLGVIPDKILLQVSGSIIKNVKSVIVPNTGGLKGMRAAVSAGIVAGDASKELEVISSVSPQQLDEMLTYMDMADMEIVHIEQGHVFDIIITASKASSSATVRISDYHTNIVYIEKDSQVLHDSRGASAASDERSERSLLSLEGIWDFANTAELDDVRELLERQIEYNTAIAREGISGDYGANVGKTLLKTQGNDVRVRAKAMAAAGSDARMNGCEMPVIINSGSGNQGITCSVPVIEYARELNVEHDRLLRALLLSNLVSIHEKTGIGTLSAYCGAVTAGSGAGAGIVYLLGGSFEDVCSTVTNALAISSGIICDGAKASCAAKIAVSLDSALLGYDLNRCDNEFEAGDGIVKEDVDSTISGVGRIGNEGMRTTNDTIIKLMIE
ncbi:MAG: serine dehydratase subunit alpha family protein [Oscillospiraceae bacterium]|nr:serine dehydratase subunit alpha family protein [Oscillospiraceae bacterium]